MKRPQQEIERALEIIAGAANRWDYEEKIGPLHESARKYPKKLTEYFYSKPDQQFAIASCLSAIKNKEVKDFFIREARNRSQYIRWFAIMNLHKYRSKSLIGIFVTGLRDRSDLVKGESLEAVENLRDGRIEKALQHLLSLKSFKKNSPGHYAQAKELLRCYGRV